MVLLEISGLTIGASVAVFLIIVLLLVVLLLVAKAKLMPSGNVKLTVNSEKEIETPIGGTLLGAPPSGNILLSSPPRGGRGRERRGRKSSREAATFCPPKRSSSAANR